MSVCKCGGIVKRVKLVDGDARQCNTCWRLWPTLEQDMKKAWEQHLSKGKYDDNNTID